MVKSLESEVLSKSQYEATVLELNKKCRVYGNGCIKRGKNEEGEEYLAMPKKYLKAVSSKL
jgi:hypothetical protein